MNNIIDNNINNNKYFEKIKFITISESFMNNLV